MSKFLIAVASTSIVLAFTVSAPAQEAVPSDDKPYSMTLSDSDAVLLAEAIKAHIYQSPPVGETINVFDRKKGQIVTLKYDKIITGDTNAVKTSQSGYIAVSVACTEVKEDQSTPDNYILWFVMKKEKKTETVVNYGMVETVSDLTEKWAVKDVIIRSVNGEQMYTWSLDESGKLVPSLAVAPANP